MRGRGACGSGGGPWRERGCCRACLGALAFRIWDLGFRAQGLGFKVGFRV